MFQRLSGLLRFLFQGLPPASFPRTEQAQSVLKQDMIARHSITTGEKNLKETGPVAAVPLLAKERVTEPYRAVRHWKRPAERYRELDAMLAEIKQDRLLHSETMLLPVPASHLAQRLYRKLEQEDGNEL
jgi:hypothetical protein